MNRHSLILVFLVVISIFSFLSQSALNAEDLDISTKIITQEQAAEFASMLANEKFQNSFGVAPFTPDSYVAQLVDSRWHWGKIEPPGINGRSAEVEFNVDRSDPTVRVAYHTDALDTIIEGPRKKE